MLPEMTTPPNQDSLGHRVAVGLAKIGLALKSHAWQNAGQQGLTPTQGQVLTLLRTKGATGMRLSEVASELAVTAATTSDAVTTLVEKALVLKTRAVDDGRAIAITLTLQGQQVAEQVADWSDLLLNAVSELSIAEQEVFLQGIIKMIRKLQEQKLISVSRMCVTCQFFRPNIYTDAERPHHCAFVDAPFGDCSLQVDCPDHIAAQPMTAERI